MRVYKEIELRHVSEVSMCTYTEWTLNRLCQKFIGLDTYLLDYIDDYFSDTRETPTLAAVSDFLEELLADAYIFGRCMYPFLFECGHVVTACKVYAATEEEEDWYGDAFEIVDKLI